MPVYFFHVTEDDALIRDLEGIERADQAAAEKEAIDAASGLIAEAVKSGERNSRGRLDVEDGQGDRVLTVTFACRISTEVAHRRAPQD